MLHLRRCALLCALLIAGFSLASAQVPFVEEYPNLDFEGGMDRILTPYLSLYEELVVSNPARVSDLARELGVTVKQLNLVNIEFKHEPHYKHLKSQMLKSSREMMKASSLKEMRRVFKHLSKHIANWATITEPKDLIVVYCPIANARWIQPRGKLRNPYFGALRMSCGQIVGGEKGPPVEAPPKGTSPGEAPPKKAPPKTTPPSQPPASLQVPKNL